MRVHVKITPRKKRRHAAGLFSRGVIFTRAHVSLALLSQRKNGGLLVVYTAHYACNNTEMNLKSTNINVFDFGIIKSLMAFWVVRLTWLDCKSNPRQLLFIRHTIWTQF